MYILHIYSEYLVNCELVHLETLTLVWCCACAYPGISTSSIKVKTKSRICNKNWGRRRVWTNLNWIIDTSVWLGNLLICSEVVIIILRIINYFHVSFSLSTLQCIHRYQLISLLVHHTSTYSHSICQRWTVKWTTASPNSYQTAEISSYRTPNPNIPIFLLILSIVTETAELSFSTMRRVLTYLRSTMPTEIIKN